MTNIFTGARPAATDRDWVHLYEQSFPESERASLAVLEQDLESGRRMLHRSLDASGALLCFSLVYLFDDFVWLSYMATNEARRSSGIGAAHLTALRAEFADKYRALVLEIESPQESGLSAETSALRLRRRNFYTRAGAASLHASARYVMPNFVEGEAALAAELLWFDLGAHPIDLDFIRGVVRQTYVRIYSLKADDPLIAQVVASLVLD